MIGMAISQSALARLLLYAVLLGGCLGVCYDVLGLNRVFFGGSFSPRTAAYLQTLRLPWLRSRQRAVGKGRLLKIAVFFSDFLFCVIAGCFVILLFYQFNSGKIRIPALVCVAVGFVLYRMTLGQLTAVFFEWVIFLSKTAVRYVAFFLLFPFRRVGSRVKRQIRYLLERRKSRVDARRRSAFTAQETSRLEQNACGMIFEPVDCRLDESIKIGEVK